MHYYPVYLDLKGKKCLVVGGGRVAFRKVKTLLSAGARVAIVSPAFLKLFASLEVHPTVRFAKRAYRSSDIQDIFLVIAATDDPEVNRRVSEDCFRERILVNVIDQPKLCNFVAPSIVQRGPLTISISTAGKSPALAKTIRKDLESRFGPEYATLLNMLGALRNGHHRYPLANTPAKRKRMWEEALQTGALELIRHGKAREAKRRIEACLSRWSA